MCSWSLRASSPEDLVTKIRACEVSAVQLALEPMRRMEWRTDDLASRLRAEGITVVSGMMETKGEDYTTLESIARTGGVRPDETWPDNLKAAEANAILASRLGLNLVTFHAGFLPHEAADPVRKSMIERLVQIAEIFAARNVRVAFETGQESAQTLIGVLEEINSRLSAHAAVGVNFDPANMILYGMGEPVAALKALAPMVRQIHIKDATPAAVKGQWGQEVPVGSGKVDWPAFVAEAARLKPAVDLVIEREAGEDRIGDVRTAKATLSRLVTT